MWLEREGAGYASCVSRKKQEWVLGYIEIRKNEEAGIELQAERPEDLMCRNGYLVPVGELWGLSLDTVLS